MLCAAFALHPVRGAAAVEKVVVVGLFRDRAIVTIDGTQRVLNVGTPSPEGIVLVSATSSEAVIEVNGVRGSYKLGSHIGGQFKPRDAGGGVTVAPDSHGMYMVTGSINGFQAQFVVDTGATFIAMNRNEAKRMGIDYRLDGTESRSRTASGISAVWLVELDRVRVGELELRDVKAAVHDGDFPEVILLGNSFLNRFDLVRQGQLLQLRPK